VDPSKELRHDSGLLFQRSAYRLLLLVVVAMVIDLVK